LSALRHRKKLALVIIRRLLWSRALRAFADGYVSLLLPVYLVTLGFGPFHVGVVATVTLLGSGVLTFLVGYQAHRYDYRTLLIAAALLMAATGASFAAVTDFWPLLLIAFLGTLNPSSVGVTCRKLRGGDAPAECRPTVCLEARSGLQQPVRSVEHDTERRIS
jgi:MFS family permease